MAFNFRNDTQFIADNIRSLYTHASSVEKGKDWECVVNIAIALQLLCSSHIGPFELISSGNISRPFTSDFCHLPDECTSLPDVLQRVRSVAVFSENSVSSSSVTLAIPSYAKFPDFDGFLIFKRGSADVICGYQTKLSRCDPKKDRPESVSFAYILRGPPPEDRRALRRGWCYLGSEDMAGLLGYSLSFLTPKEWPPLPDGNDGFD
jgi:hypothetical protein